MKRKVVFVPDLPSALRLQTKFEGSAVHLLDCGINIVMNKRGRKRVHGSGAERTKESRSRMKANIAAINNMLCPKYDYSSSIMEKICNENTIVIDNNVTKIRVFLFGAKNEPLPFEYRDINSIVEMECFLESRKKMKFSSKEENRLFSLTKFDPSKSDLNYRGLDNVEYTYGILLDFDGGDLKPEDLARIFPELRMTIYSTYSSTKDNLKFRVYLPTSLKMDRETYCNITNHILCRIIENGYQNHEKLAGSISLSHGLDMTKMHPASLFYLPCQPLDKTGKYFQIFKGGERAELDVMRVIDEMTIPDEELYEEVIEPWFCEQSPISQNRKETIIEAAKIRFWEAALTKSIGNQSFYSLACSLAAAGCDEYEIRQILMSEAHNARNPRERLREIPNIMKSLRNRNYIKPIYAAIDAHSDNGMRNA